MALEIRKEINEFFAVAESDYNVNAWTYKGIHLWPYIKQYLFFKAITNPKQHTDSTPLAKIFYIPSLLNFIKALFFGKRRSSVYGMMDHFRHTDNDSGVLINKFYNDLIENEKETPLIIDHSAKHKTYRSQVDYKANTLFSFELKLLILIIRNLFYSKKEIPSLKNSDTFNEFIQAYNTKFTRVDKKEISKGFYQIYLCSRLYKRLFKTNRIQKVYVLSYYLSDMYAMLIAGNELQLDTFDIQHGSQGDLHVAYNNLSKVPTEGYSLLPKYFLCWNKQAVAAINSWAEKTMFHKALLHGNPWESYNSTEEYNTEANNLTSNIFLVTLQPIGDHLIEPYFLNVIKATKSKYNWYLRLHPRQLHLKSQLNKLLKDNSLLEFVNVEEATSLPLPQLLKNTRMHFSKFSGSIEEAAAFNVMSVIMDEIGVHTYKHIIEKGLGHSCTQNSKEELMEYLYTVENV